MRNTATNGSNYPSHVIRLRRSYWDASSSAKSADSYLQTYADGTIRLVGENGTPIFSANQSGNSVADARVYATINGSVVDVLKYQ